MDVQKFVRPSLKFFGYFLVILPIIAGWLMQSNYNFYLWVIQNPILTYLGSGPRFFFYGLISIIFGIVFLIIAFFAKASTLQIFIHTVLNIVLFLVLWFIVGMQPTVMHALLVYGVVIVLTVVAKRMHADKGHGKIFYGLLVFDIFFGLLMLPQLFGTPD